MASNSIYTGNGLTQITSSYHVTVTVTFPTNFQISTADTRRPFVAMSEI